jgi:nucleoid-associated protein YgaU
MKKIIPVLLSLLIVFFGLTLLAQEYSYDYEEMSMDEYKTELAKWQKCEADNKAQIADVEDQIASVNDQMAATQNQTDSVWNDVYSLLGTDKAGYESYLNDLNGLKSDLSGFLALSPEEIYTRKSELEDLKNRLAELKKDKRSLSSEAQNQISQIENMISEAEQKAEPAAAGRYEVVRGDYLWKISKMPDIYGDPYAWIRIYTYNRDQIKNPDLIYPAQVFRIPRMAGPNEYWVKRGEFLYKIAGSADVYGDPFKWQRIYEANKGIIADPNLIYPHMVLQIPQQ